MASHAGEQARTANAEISGGGRKRNLCEANGRPVHTIVEQRHRFDAPCAHWQGRRPHCQGHPTLQLFTQSEPAHIRSSSNFCGLHLVFGIRRSCFSPAKDGAHWKQALPLRRNIAGHLLTFHLYLQVLGVLYVISRLGKVFSVLTWAYVGAPHRPFVLHCSRLLVLFCFK